MKFSKKLIVIAVLFITVSIIIFASFLAVRYFFYDINVVDNSSHYRFEYTRSQEFDRYLDQWNLNKNPNNVLERDNIEILLQDQVPTNASYSINDGKNPTQIVVAAGYSYDGRKKIIRLFVSEKLQSGMSKVDLENLVTSVIMRVLLNSVNDTSPRSNGTKSEIGDAVLSMRKNNQMPFIFTFE